MICSMKELLEEAEASDRAVGAFSVGSMEMVLGAVKAAEAMETPIILQIAEGRLRHSPLELMGPMMVEAAKKSPMKIAVHLDHGQTMGTLKRALDYGFTSIMIDGSAGSLEENIRRTKEAKELASHYGAAVEAELGIVGGSEGGPVEHKIGYTDPDEAEQFFKETGVDALAVAIGNAHGNYREAPRLRFDVLEAIHGRVKAPLVLHGGSGITFEDFRKTIESGMRKINIATASFNSLTERAGEYLKAEREHTYFGLNEAMVQGVYENVKTHIYVFNNKEDLSKL